MSANGSMKAELLKHIKGIIEDQEASGGPMMVGLSDQDVEEIAARIKGIPRYKMVGLDLLRKSVKEVVGKALLNVAPLKEPLVEPPSLGKREPEKDKTTADGEAGFVRNLTIIQLLRRTKRCPTSISAK